MEGLSVAANVLAVLNLAAKTAELVYKYSKAAKNYPKAVEELRKELSAIQTTFKALENVAKKLDIMKQKESHDNPAIVDLVATLHGCRETLEEVRDELGGSLRNKFFEKIHVRLHWPIKEAKITAVISNLRSYQQIFQTALQIDTAWVLS